MATMSSTRERSGCSKVVENLRLRGLCRAPNAGFLWFWYVYVEGFGAELKRRLLMQNIYGFCRGRGGSKAKKKAHRRCPCLLFPDPVITREPVRGIGTCFTTTRVQGNPRICRDKARLPNTKCCPACPRLHRRSCFGFA